MSFSGGTCLGKCVRMIKSLSTVMKTYGVKTYRSTFSWPRHWLVCDRLHIPAGNHWIAGWVGPRASTDTVENRKFLTSEGLELRASQSCSPQQQRYPISHKTAFYIANNAYATENYCKNACLFTCTARVFSRDSPGKAAQWLARSIRESWGGVVISHSFAFKASRRLNFIYKSIENDCTAFLSTLVSMLELSPPLPVLLLLRVGGLSRLNTRAYKCWTDHTVQGL
jgi:hypothetical protein